LPKPPAKVQFPHENKSVEIMKLHHGDDPVAQSKKTYLGQHYDEASGSLFSGESSSDKDSPSEEENSMPDEGSSYYSYDTEYENPPMKHKVAENDQPDTDMQL